MSLKFHSNPIKSNKIKHILVCNINYLNAPIVFRCLQLEQHLHIRIKLARLRARWSLEVLKWQSMKQQCSLHRWEDRVTWEVMTTTLSSLQHYTRKSQYQFQILCNLENKMDKMKLVQVELTYSMSFLCHLLRRFFSIIGLACGGVTAMGC